MSKKHKGANGTQPPAVRVTEITEPPTGQVPEGAVQVQPQEPAKPGLTADISIRIRDGRILDPEIQALGGAKVTFGDMKAVFTHLAGRMDQNFFAKATKLGALVYTPEEAPAAPVPVPAPTGQN